MPAKLSTTISKVTAIPNETNSALVTKFYEYMRTNGASERHQNNSLKMVIAFANYLEPDVTFYDITRKDQVTASHNGIIAENEIQRKPSILICYRCDFANTIETKYCSKCSYPLKPEAYDEIKAEEDRKFQALREKQQEKDEQLKAVNQQVNMMQSQMQALITTLGNMDKTSKNSFAKQLFQIGMYKTEK
jgi:flagellar motor switch protein FliG